ncbi:methyltransferase domain-containing protein [Candidatus Microgenomates bacterium]|nr:methyltransferase domain-containing protein [Candidatus Microgenomates bacterium]
MAKEAAPDFNFAEQYAAYAEKYPVYRTAADRLIALAKAHTDHSPGLVADVACGVGLSTALIASAYPDAQVVGFDKSPAMLELARKRSTATFVEAGAEELIYDAEAGLAFCSAGYWYFDHAKALPRINSLVRSGGLFLFNISEPAIDFGDGKYDDRFLQTMVEVLDNVGIVFHRKEGYGTGRLKLSYRPPTRMVVEEELRQYGFQPIDYAAWEFQKSLDELIEFYSIPGFGTKAYRELADSGQKKQILDEIKRRLEADGVKAINFRWAEFVARRP